MFGMRGRGLAKRRRLVGQSSRQSRSRLAIFYFFFYCKVSQRATAQGFLCVQEVKLDALSHFLHFFVLIFCR